MTSMKLDEFIDRVKAELLAAQNKPGEKLLLLQEVKLTAQFSVEKEADGTVKLSVPLLGEAGLGAKGTEGKTHTVELTFTPIGVTEGMTQQLKEFLLKHGPQFTVKP